MPVDLDGLIRRVPGLRRLARPGDVGWIVELLGALPAGDAAAAVRVFALLGGEVGGLLVETPNMRLGEAFALVHLAFGEPLPEGFRYRDAAEEASARQYAEGLKALVTLLRRRHPGWSRVAVAAGEEMLLQVLRLRWEEDPS